MIVAGADPETGQPFPQPLFTRRSCRSILITGPKASGKSFLLDGLAEQVTAAGGVDLAHLRFGRSGTPAGVPGQILLGRAAARAGCAVGRPLVLLADDLHRASPEDAQDLASLLSVHQDLNVAVVGTCLRPGDLPAGIRAWQVIVAPAPWRPPGGTRRRVLSQRAVR